MTDDSRRQVAPAGRAMSTNRIVRSIAPARMVARAAVRWAGTYAAWGDGRRRKRERAMMRTAEDVTRTMGEMKGAVMKLGQVLSLMSGVMPDELTSQLASLQADAPPMAYNLVEEVFAREFGASPQKLFRHFEKEPFAAASIGQVHRARLEDGTRVAVKVQYPGVQQAIEHDLANAGWLISLVGAFSQGLDAATIVRDLKEGILGELDYEREAAAQQEFAATFAGHAFVRVPDVFRDRSTRHVLVQEYLDGAPFSATRDMTQEERNRIGEIVFRYAFGSIYRHGLFNGDPHPGNYLLLPDGKVGFIDYGCVARFDDSVVAGFLRVLNALYAHDLDAWRLAVEDLGILQREAPFSTDELYEHMHWYWAPILEDDVTFTPELAAEMVRHNTQTTGLGGRINQHCNVPAGMVFLTRINFGLAGLLANLRAAGNWREIVREYTEGIAPTTELGRQSAATSRGPAI